MVSFVASLPEEMRDKKDHDTSLNYCHFIKLSNQRSHLFGCLFSKIRVIFILVRSEGSQLLSCQFRQFRSGIVIYYALKGFLAWKHCRF